MVEMSAAGVRLVEEVVGLVGEQTGMRSASCSVKSWGPGQLRLELWSVTEWAA